MQAFFALHHDGERLTLQHKMDAYMRLQHLDCLMTC